MQIFCIGISYKWNHTTLYELAEYFTFEMWIWALANNCPYGKLKLDPNMSLFATYMYYKDIFQDMKKGPHIFPFHHELLIYELKSRKMLTKIKNEIGPYKKHYSNNKYSKNIYDKKNCYGGKKNFYQSILK